MSDTPENLAPAAADPLPVLDLAAPVLRPKSESAKRLEVRLWSGLIFFLSSLLLAVGLYLHPDAHGLGSHQQLGFPPCGLYATTGVPCPTCGCTTAVAHVAHGHFLRALRTQPFGAAVGFLALAGTLLGFIGLVSARWVGPQPFTLQWHYKAILIAGVALLLGGWIYKIIAVRYGL